MSNPQHNPEPQGQGGPAYTQVPASSSPHQPTQPTAKPEASFFRWIRESRVERTNDRVIAGVCGAIARELGWNVTLVRVLMVVSVFFGGFGGLLYGIAWLLLPDELDHRILLEEIIAGQWDWAFVGVILAIVIAGGFGFGVGFDWDYGFGLHWGINVMPLLLAMLVFYLLVDNGRRRFRAPVAPPAPSGTPYPPQPNAYTSGGAPVRPMPQPSAPAQPVTQQPVMPQRPVPPQSMAAAPNPQQQAWSQAYPQTASSAAVPPAAQPYAQSAMPMGAAPAAQQAPAYTAQPAAAAVPMPATSREPRRARRKGAGPMVVLLFFGLILASAGILAIVLDDRTTFIGEVQPLIIYVGAIVAVLGAIIVVLGCCGRRTGGLHPFVWTLMFLAACFMAVGGAWSVMDQYKNTVSRDYTRIGIGPDSVDTSLTAKDMDEITKGIAVSGQGMMRSTLDINLSDYAKANGKHTIELRDGKTKETTCPVGTIPMTVEDARVVITIPDGCSWGFDSSLHDGTVDSFGNRYSAMTSGDPFDVLGGNGDWSNIRVTVDENSTRVHIPGIDVRVMDDDDLDESIDDLTDGDGDREPAHVFVTSENFRSQRMARLCDGVSVVDGKVEFESGANSQMRQLVKDGYYWPCAVLADAAPATPELVIQPNVVIGGNITVRYASQR
ncbi:PspC domain-containing protein [Bifidobacterium pseudolongum subsp. globosum]|uniref:Phage shock protein C, PspC n=1 Tax=Bifidobacterium pseudolongum subsp. globosum TaxID=1690 RepID=A0A2N3QUQ0_9BIFI|nr:PspC domain-containing protein [Bifidobacterium pseudolongum]PKU95797.1 phage shock protein C, PspC [Bifidobacterium pseudolongum subsp. globosum]PKV04454.1 phage shock protein C, PspC [Bifidobacterium pseudolongum subsp. globosum]RYP96319.1 PspC domain-containing protein [Bifidobacterium pseudolongum subsp. globosum]RYQ02758.1 PspC domain-containing protein [Bifidobacterium pseudolongum subsp. globosum]RYQ18352.1 PspC domain-containing protein [Bifidobacterium pseudolongum subsp. globosum]